MKRKLRTKLRRNHKIYNHIVANYLFNDYRYDGNYERFLEKLELYKGVVQRLIYTEDNFSKIFYPESKRWERRKHIKYGKIDEKLFQPFYNISGHTTYNDIEQNLSYISDRFLCSYRLRWMLGLLDHKNNN